MVNAMMNDGDDGVDGDSKWSITAPSTNSQAMSTWKADIFTANLRYCWKIAAFS